MMIEEPPFNTGDQLQSFGFYNERVVDLARGRSITWKASKWTSPSGLMDTTPVTAWGPISSCTPAIWHTSSTLMMKSRARVLCAKIQPTLRQPRTCAIRSARLSSSVCRSRNSLSALPSCAQPCRREGGALLSWNVHSQLSDTGLVLLQRCMLGSWT